MSDIKLNLRILRTQLDVTQEEFAKLLNMPTATYRKKENGKSPLLLEEAYKISKIANKSIEELFLNKSDHNGQ